MEFVLTCDFSFDCEFLVHVQSFSKGVNVEKRFVRPKVLGQGTKSLDYHS